MFGAREEEGVEKKVGRDGFIYKEVRRRKKRFVNWNGRLEREREREREKQSAAGLVQGIRESESIG